MGRALLGRREDDDVRVETPGGMVSYVVLGIAVERPESS